MFEYNWQFDSNTGSYSTGFRTMWLFHHAIYENHHWRISDRWEQSTSFNSKFLYHFYSCLSLIILKLIIFEFAKLVLYSSPNNHILGRTLMRCVKSGRNAYMNMYTGKAGMFLVINMSIAAECLQEYLFLIIQCPECRFLQFSVQPTH